MSEENPILRAEKIYKSYGSLDIIKGLDFSVHNRSSCSIVGKSGSGKSTLLHLLALLDRKDGGKIYYNGKDSDTFSDLELSELRKNLISFVFQDSLLFEDFTALENVILSLTIAGFDKKSAKERAASVLESMDLKERMGHFPRELSGGERQRTAIARAVAGNAHLVFLDEPTGSLDEEAKAGVENLLFSSPFFKEKAFVIVTHDIDLSMKTENRYLLKGGVLEKL